MMMNLKDIHDLERFLWEFNQGCGNISQLEKAFRDFIDNHIERYSRRNMHRLFLVDEMKHAGDELDDIFQTTIRELGGKQIATWDTENCIYSKYIIIDQELPFVAVGMHTDKKVAMVLSILYAYLYIESNGLIFPQSVFGDPT